MSFSPFTSASVSVGSGTGVFVCVGLELPGRGVELRFESSLLPLPPQPPTVSARPAASTTAATLVRDFTNVPFLMLSITVSRLAES
ncbi:hypothetical protein GCM10012280_59620 [Wenjunlia tyrosinilytica]|uniref:Uncharacterized protein n=1 Tax=Wenjunlia tyrosinilytica TaxID=1544741 RepID=A0A917ZXQ4_9ACTN|nr:hypothetical protein GCM10012280_59620 [Wenjunlia tyrosinilytica]